MEFKMATLQAENARLIEEERRKTLVEETKHAKAVCVLYSNIFPFIKGKVL
jgi:hypothetical protein